MYGSILEWTAIAATSEPQPGWERCFNFREKDGQPYFKASRLMKYADSIVKVQNNSGISLYTYMDSATGGLMLSAYLNLGGSGNMARFENSQLIVGDAYFVNYSPTGATQDLYVAYYRNFRINLSAAAITLSFSGGVSSGNYPYRMMFWLVPKSSVTGTPKHTVTWPSNVYWASTNAHKNIGAAGKPDTPVLVELTTFDNGGTWIGKAINVLFPEQEV